jgi:hypothetical protein
MMNSGHDVANDNDDEPYRRGREDFVCGLPRHLNPYDSGAYGTTMWEAWFDGWDDASDERGQTR